MQYVPPQIRTVYMYLEVLGQRLVWPEDNSGYWPSSGLTTSTFTRSLETRTQVYQINLNVVIVMFEHHRNSQSNCISNHRSG